MIETKYNSVIKNNTLMFVKKVPSSLSLGYTSLIQYNNINYIYYREDIKQDCFLDSQIIKRFIITNKLALLKDKSYSLNLGIASHNFRLFNFNNLWYGIGGQSLGSANYKSFKNITNSEYLNYHKKDIKFISKNDYGINSLAGDKIYDPNHYCP